MTILTDKALTSIDGKALYDRVINILLITEDDNEYMIRSDYELDYGTSILNTLQKSAIRTTYTIHRCTYKPDIKIKYHQVTEGQSIEVQLDISNFYVFDSSGTLVRDFVFNENNIKLAYVMIGYFEQFAQLPHSTYEELKAQFNLTWQKALTAYGITLLAISYTNGYIITTGLPPNYSIQAIGFVGDMLFEVPVLSQKASIVPEVVAESSTMIDVLWRELISKHYPNYNAIALCDRTIITKLANTEKGMPNWSITGIRLIKTKLVENLCKARFGIVDKVPDLKFDLPKVKTMLDAMNFIKSVIGEVVFIELHSGDYVCLHISELKNKNIVDEVNKYSAEKELSITINKLPAVYNITNTVGVSIIEAPFYTFLAPFDTFKFVSKYSSTDITIAFSGDRTDTYKVISQTVEFATVKKDNKMTISCVKGEEGV